MQNQEVDDVYNKFARFVLRDRNDNDITEKNIVNQNNEYTVFWYDAKMKNYLSFIEYVLAKRYVQVKITGILIVDKKEYLDNIEKIKRESKNDNLKKEV